MTREELLQKLSEIEWDDFECKAAQEKLPEDVWETVFAFSNTSGRWIVFGIKQHGKQVSATVCSTVDGPIQLLINTIRDNSDGISDIQKKLNIKSRRCLHESMLTLAIDKGYVLRAYPDKPSHPKQHYYLSEKGLKLVK